MRKIVIATKNPGKIKEFTSILGNLNFEIFDRATLKFNDEIEETGSTFEENAKIKAVHCFKKLKIATIADDSGLEIDALNGRPGVFSARYASVNNVPASDEENINKILDEMKFITNRKARLVCALCFINNFGQIFSIVETCEGEISQKPFKMNGFGFDSIFMFKGKPLSSFSSTEKNMISHRGKATRKLVKCLNMYWDKQN